MMSHSPDRRRFGALALSLPLAGLAGGHAHALVPPFSAASQGRVRVAVGGAGLLYHLPLTIARQLDFFRAEGLDVAVFARAVEAAMSVLSVDEKRRFEGRLRDLLRKEKAG